MLFIDQRDGSSELFDTFAALGAPPDLVHAFHGQGSTADVFFSGNGPQGSILAGVEVKKLPDLLSSVSTGRLSATQIPKMLEGQFQEIYLLIIGEYRPGHNGQLEIHRGGGRFGTVNLGQRSPIPFSYLESYLVEVQALGVQLKQVADIRAACCWLTIAHNWWQKPWDSHKAMKKFDISRNQALMPDTGDPEYKQKEQDARIYSQLPKIGWERAWALAEHFPSVIDAGCVSVSEWCKVAGIGLTIAKLAQEALRGRRKAGV